MGFAFSTPKIGEKELVIGKVDKNSAAEIAGLRKGDVLIEFMGQPLPSKGNPVLRAMALKNLQFKLPYSLPTSLKIRRVINDRTITMVITYLAK